VPSDVFLLIQSALSEKMSFYCWTFLIIDKWPISLK
jgi:hypothetical protein